MTLPKFEKKSVLGVKKNTVKSMQKQRPDEKRCGRSK